MKTDHIKPKSEKGSDNIDNAISLCFECHSEVHMYNDKHPRGRKYHSEELLLHKKQWLEICKKNPDILVNEMKPSHSGPIMSLLSELEYNHIICGIPILYENNEFHDSVNNGILSFLDENIKENIMATYGLINLTNTNMKKFFQIDETLRTVYDLKQKEILKKQKETDEAITSTITAIKEFLNKT